MDDVIYRKDAIDAIRLTSSPWLTELIDPYRAQVKALKELPSAQMKEHWVQNDNGTWSCSKCQSWIPNEQHYYANFCLYCGADMREEEN